jgi:hypothetical protein
LTVGNVNALTLKRPDLAQFKSELKDVIADAELREDRVSEILMQTTDIWAFFASILPIGPDKTPATWLLITIAQQLAMHVEMRFKHELACARPDEYSAQVQPMIRTPGHGTYPMGHMCEATLATAVLVELTKRPMQLEPAPLPAWDGLQQQLSALANRIGENRIIAGVHFAVDLHAGRALGNWLGNYFSQVCQLQARNEIPLEIEHLVFDPKTYSTSKTAGSSVQIASDNILTTLWEQARSEWQWLIANQPDCNQI